MSRLRKLLPSPNALIAFESAARLSSFKLAAKELGITQPSISQTIKAMEDRLAVKLFERGNRGVSLTSAGVELMNVVEPALKKIETRLNALSQRNSHALTIAASTSVSAQWLLSLTVSFQRAHPEINVRLITTDRNIEPGHEVDLTIRRAPLDWDRANCWHLVDEVLFVICSQAYLERKGPIRSILDLCNHDIIHNAEPYRNRMNWQQWLEAQGIHDLDLPQTLVLNDYQLVIQACLAGEGVALGWSITTEPLVNQGILVRPLETKVHTNHAFFIVGPRSIQISSRKRQYIDWIKAGLIKAIRQSHVP